jgi:hypothetical protein
LSSNRRKQPTAEKFPRQPLLFVIEKYEEAHVNGPTRWSIRGAIVVLEASVRSSSNTVGARIIILEHNNLLRRKSIGIAIDVIRMVFEKVVMSLVILWVVGSVDSGSVLRVIPVRNIGSIDNKQRPDLHGVPHWSPYIDNGPALVLGDEFFGLFFF